MKNTRMICMLSMCCLPIGCTNGLQDGKEPHLQFSGVFVSFQPIPGSTDNVEITMQNPSSEENSVIHVPLSVEVVIDGKQSKIGDLQKGMKLLVFCRFKTVEKIEVPRSIVN